MNKPEFTIRDINPVEIDNVADLLSAGYYKDVFFKWSVDNDNHRRKVLFDYYKIYLTAAGCVTHVAESSSKGIIGVAVWLPHNVDASIYNDIDKAVGVYAPQFRAVCDKSHDSEPPMEPFYQLVGFVVHNKMQGMGIGGALLKYHLDKLDKLGIPTYLEASTPYFGGGAYGPFNYQPVGELMVFADNAVLYPLWRPVAANTIPPISNYNNTTATEKDIIPFGGYNWLVLEMNDNKMLLLSEKIIELRKYHDTFDDVTWANSTVRKYLNTTFFSKFNPQEQLRIAETQVCNKLWFGGNDADTTDKIFLLSTNEVMKYLGSDGKTECKNGKFYIDDSYNNARRAVNVDNWPCRWTLRTPGNLPYLTTTVTTDGKIAVTGDFVNRSSTELFNVGIRPAMWVTK